MFYLENAYRLHILIHIQLALIPKMFAIIYQGRQLRVQIDNLVLCVLATWPPDSHFQKVFASRKELFRCILLKKKKNQHYN